MLEDLQRLRQELISGATTVSVSQLLRRPRVAWPTALVLVAMVLFAIWFIRRTTRVGWAREKALPQITQLIGQGDYYAAFRLARQVERYIPVDPAFERLRKEFSLANSIRTTPPGAEVYFRSYSNGTDQWEYIGKAPIEKCAYPSGKFSMAGHQSWL
jgi:hypothetical protein